MTKTVKGTCVPVQENFSEMDGNIVIAHAPQKLRNCCLLVLGKCVRQFVLWAGPRKSLFLFAVHHTGDGCWCLCSLTAVNCWMVLDDCFDFREGFGSVICLGWGDSTPPPPFSYEEMFWGSRVGGSQERPSLLLPSK